MDASPPTGGLTGPAAQSRTQTGVDTGPMPPKTAPAPTAKPRPRQAPPDRTAPGVVRGGTAGTARPVPRPAPADRSGSGADAARPQPVRPSGPRRARLLVTRLDPWSVMKTFFMLSLAVAIVLVVSTAVLWWTLDVTGVFVAVNRTVDDVVGTGSTPFDFMAVVGFDRVMGGTLVLAAIEIVLLTAMATLFAFLYNLTVGFTRGLEVTLTEDN